MTEYENELFRAELGRYATKLYAGTDAETFIAGAAEDLIDEGITFISQEPKKIARVIAVLNDNTTFPEDEDEDDPDDLIDASVWEDGAGIHLNASGSTVTLDYKQALAAVNLLSSALNRALMCPWSEDDPSSILSRGIRHVLREA